MTSFGYLLLGLVLVATFVVVLYNRLVALRQATRNAFADVDVQMKQRYDLIPNLVETVKGYAKHENELFTKVTEARAGAMQAGSTLAARGAAENALSGVLTQLFAVAENYPDLKANANFQQLQSELGDLENKIAAARRFFNNAVAEYNTGIQQFPAILLARAFGFTEMDMFNVNGDRAAVETAPKVTF